MNALQTAVKSNSIKRYLNFDNALQSDNTIKVYGYLLKKFNGALTDAGVDWQNDPELVTRQTVCDYLESLKQQGQSNAGLNSNLKAIKKFYNMLIDKGICENNPCQGIKYYNEKKATSKNKWLNDEQLEKLFKAMRKDKTESGSRDFAIINLLLHTGLRASELCELKFSDIIYNNEKPIELSVRHGKGDKYREVEINESILKPVFEYRAIAGLEITENGDDYLFYSTSTNLNPERNPLKRHCLYHIVKRAGRKIKVNIWTHCLRHTFASHALQKGASLVAVKNRLGHASITTTESIYVHSDNKCLEYLNFDFIN